MRPWTVTPKTVVPLLHFQLPHGGLILIPSRVTLSLLLNLGIEVAQIHFDYESHEITAYC